MKRKLENAVKNWLKAERGGDPNRAEQTLRQVFLRLPRYAPPPGFALGVLRRLGLAPAGMFSPPRLTLRWKVALAACFALVALAVNSLPRTLGALWAGVGPGKVIDLGAGALVSLSARLADGIVVWGTLSDVARTVSTAFASPSMMATVAGLALISAAALRLLHGLMLPERNGRHAQPS